jgi:hypothetical protein
MRYTGLRYLESPQSSISNVSNVARHLGFGCLKDNKVIGKAAKSAEDMPTKNANESGVSSGKCMHLPGLP